MFINEESIIYDIFSRDCMSVLYVLMHLADMLLAMCMEGWLGVCVFMNLMATDSSQIACLLVMLVITQYSRVLRLSKLLTE